MAVQEPLMTAEQSAELRGHAIATVFTGQQDEIIQGRRTSFRPPGNRPIRDKRRTGARAKDPHRPRSDATGKRSSLSETNHGRAQSRIGRARV